MVLDNGISGEKKSEYKQKKLFFFEILCYYLDNKGVIK